jgi:hypothetical protein
MGGAETYLRVIWKAARPHRQLNARWRRRILVHAVDERVCLVHCANYVAIDEEL